MSPLRAARPRRKGGEGRREGAGPGSSRRPGWRPELEGAGPGASSGSWPGVAGRTALGLPARLSLTLGRTVTWLPSPPLARLASRTPQGRGDRALEIPQFRGTPSDTPPTSPWLQAGPAPLHTGSRVTPGCEENRLCVQLWWEVAGHVGVPRGLSGTPETYMSPEALFLPYEVLCRSELRGSGMQERRMVQEPK